MNGYAPEYVLFGKHKIEQISATADGGSDPNIVKEDYTENVFGSNGLKRFDFGLGFRIGAELQKRYSVSLGYDWGLIDEYTSDTDKNNTSIYETPTLRNRNLTISLSYKF